MADTEVDTEEFVRDILSKLADSINQAGGENYFGDTLIGYELTPEDLEAEVCDWTRRFLLELQCPEDLTSLITRTVYKDLKDVPALYSNVANADLKLYQANRVRAAIVIRVIAFCETACFDDELVDKIYEMYSNPSSLPIVSVAAIKNCRKKMEDRHVAIPNLNALCNLNAPPNYSYYAVFDGHAGNHTAVYGASHLHFNIIHHPQFEKNIEVAMRDAFKITDERYIEKAKRDEVKMGGTTVVCAIVKDNYLHMAWLGDSVACIVRNGKEVVRMDPHKPSREDEKKRIEALGGCVILYGTWRVNGALAVSRALGDLEYKPYVSNEPDIASVPLDGNEDFFVMACDGLWDTITPEYMILFVHRYLIQNNGNTDGIAKALVQEAKARGSNDNITAIVVFFNPEIDLKKSEQILASVPSTIQFPQDGNSTVVFDSMSQHKNSTEKAANLMFNEFNFNLPSEIRSPGDGENQELHNEIPTPPVDHDMSTPDIFKSNDSFSSWTQESNNKLENSPSNNDDSNVNNEMQSEVEPILVICETADPIPTDSITLSPKINLPSDDILVSTPENETESKHVQDLETCQPPQASYDTKEVGLVDVTVSDSNVKVLETTNIESNFTIDDSLMNNPGNETENKHVQALETCQPPQASYDTKEVGLVDVTVSDSNVKDLETTNMESNFTIDDSLMNNPGNETEKNQAIQDLEALQSTQTCQVTEGGLVDIPTSSPNMEGLETANNESQSSNLEIDISELKPSQIGSLQVLETNVSMNTDVPDYSDVPKNQGIESSNSLIDNMTTECVTQEMVITSHSFSQETTIESIEKEQINQEISECDKDSSSSNFLIEESNVSTVVNSEQNIDLMEEQINAIETSEPVSSGDNKTDKPTELTDKPSSSILMPDLVNTEINISCENNGAHDKESDSEVVTNLNHYSNTVQHDEFQVKPIEQSKSIPESPENNVQPAPFEPNNETEIIIDPVKDEKMEILSMNTSINSENVLNLDENIPKNDNEELVMLDNSNITTDLSNQNHVNSQEVEKTSSSEIVDKSKQLNLPLVESSSFQVEDNTIDHGRVLTPDQANAIAAELVNEAVKNGVNTAVEIGSSPILSDHSALQFPDVPSEDPTTPEILEDHELNSIPDGLPEADDVVEDEDSDGEHEGWSYIPAQSEAELANTEAVEKPASNAVQSKTAEIKSDKPESKDDVKSDKKNSPVKSEKPKSPVKTEKPKSPVKTEKPKSPVKTEKPKNAVKTDKPKSNVRSTGNITVRATNASSTLKKSTDPKLQPKKTELKKETATTVPRTAYKPSVSKRPIEPSKKNMEPPKSRVTSKVSTSSTVKREPLVKKETKPAKPLTKPAAKPAATATSKSLVDSKSVAKTSTKTTLSKNISSRSSAQPSASTKPPSRVPPRTSTTTSRTSKTTTTVKSTTGTTKNTVPKSVSSESKLSQASNRSTLSRPSTLKSRPPATSTQKADVKQKTSTLTKPNAKEMKETVNKKISSSTSTKTMPASRVGARSSSNTLTQRKTTTTMNKTEPSKAGVKSATGSRVDATKSTLKSRTTKTSSSIANKADSKKTMPSTKTNPPAKEKSVGEQSSKEQKDGNISISESSKDEKLTNELVANEADSMTITSTNIDSPAEEKSIEEKSPNEQKDENIFALESSKDEKLSDPEIKVIDEIKSLNELSNGNCIENETITEVSSSLSEKEMLVNIIESDPALVN